MSEKVKKISLRKFIHKIKKGLTLSYKDKNVSLDMYIQDKKKVHCMISYLTGEKKDTVSSQILNLYEAYNVIKKYDKNCLKFK